MSLRAKNPSGAVNLNKVDGFRAFDWTCRPMTHSRQPLDTQHYVIPGMPLNASAEQDYVYQRWRLPDIFLLWQNYVCTLTFNNLSSCNNITKEHIEGRAGFPVFWLVGLKCSIVSVSKGNLHTGRINRDLLNNSSKSQIVSSFQEKTQSCFTQ